MTYTKLLILGFFIFITQALEKQVFAQPRGDYGGWAWDRE